ncbi:glycosyl transferase [Myxosarcina sp. GI1]|uniref:glycosyl transferase n=1 Tax=Myxosarcina sp. GI1 TaxID=1541065 RepID=UPI000560A05D|nr:glycosyl transferase [Myxosarcina sp. GI1]
MAQPAVYIAVTGHGFGHAVRAATIASKLQQLNSNISIIFVTVAPQWLLKSYLTTDFDYRPRIFDVGVIQSDSLKMDKQATLKKMQHIIASEAAIITEEVEFIRNNNVGLILADVPALATAIAKAAKIPCWMVSNFGWDYIYSHWGEPFQEVTTWIKKHYYQSDRLFRLPLCEPMSAFPNITDVGLIGDRPRYSKEELQQKFNLNTPPEKTVLLTFGGLGIQAIPYHNLQRFSDWQFITFDRYAPDLPNLLKINDSFLRPLDFMPVCGRVFSKPGFSTFSEALCQNVPIVSLTRQDFAESEILINGIRDHSYHQIITPENFFEGEWDFLHHDSLPPRKKTTLATNGAETIAREIITFLTS